MRIAQSVGEILREQVTLELECVDRLYLNVYVPQLQYAAGVAAFLKRQRGAQVVSTALVRPMTEAFVAAIKERTALTRMSPASMQSGSSPRRCCLR